jgi:hypothetical protein
MENLSENTNVSCRVVGLRTEIRTRQMSESDCYTVIFGWSIIINNQYDGFLLKHKENTVFRFVHVIACLNMFRGQTTYLGKYGLLGKMISVYTLISYVSNSIFHLFYKASHVRLILIGNIFISRRERGKDGEVLSDCCK